MSHSQICSSSMRILSLGSTFGAIGRPSTGSYEHCGSVGCLVPGMVRMAHPQERTVHLRISHGRGHAD